jgi:hypothetical protein
MSLNDDGRPGDTTPETGPGVITSPMNSSATPTVKPTGVRRTAGRRRPRPIASASLYYPVPGRGWYWLSIRCPYCHGTHLGRVRDQAKAAGNRRVSCGPVQVIVRSTYRPSAASDAA